MDDTQIVFCAILSFILKSFPAVMVHHITFDHNNKTKSGICFFHPLFHPPIFSGLMMLIFKNSGLDTT